MYRLFKLFLIIDMFRVRSLMWKGQKLQTKANKINVQWIILFEVKLSKK